jgi:hypothetical protein
MVRGTGGADMMAGSRKERWLSSGEEKVSLKKGPLKSALSGMVVFSQVHVVCADLLSRVTIG